MSRLSDFSQIHGVAVIAWKLKTITPLCIRSGTYSAWEQAYSLDNYANKMRQVNSAYDFFVKTEKDKGKDASWIADFFHDVYLDNNVPRIRHKVPSSSLRGAIRNYTIKRLTPKPLWGVGLPPKLAQGTDTEGADPEKGQDRYKKMVICAITTSPGWHLIQNLFGMATDSQDEALEKESVAGRLQVTVGPLKELNTDEFKKGLISGNFRSFTPGSTHGRMVFTTRNPLDRVTHAAKEGALHSITELSPGNELTVTLTVTNPWTGDLGFVGFWEDGFNAGLLRLGGLTGVGRGRLSVISTDIRLFSRNIEGFSSLLKVEVEKDKAANDADVLSGIWPEYRLKNWPEVRGSYMNQLNRFYMDFDKEKTNERP